MPLKEERLVALSTDASRLGSTVVAPAATAPEPGITLRVLLDAIPLSALVIDRQRKIVAANAVVHSEFGAEVRHLAPGRRLGEALGCARVESSPGGCGTSNGCAWCSALIAIQDSQTRNTTVSAECRLLLLPERGGALDVEVRAVPLVLGGETLTLVTLQDISAKKRRRVLERIFFHDVLNTAGGICGIANVLAETTDRDAEQEFKEMLLSLSEQLVDEINSQRQLMAAETGELQVAPSEVALTDLLRGLAASWAKSTVASARRIALGLLPQTLLTTDVVLLRRVLGNMLKNALEATPEGGVVTLSAEESSEFVTLSVHNDSAIPEEVRYQIFLRSFSTKGEGRGIGTYSIKLLGEKFLGGKVDFSSSEAQGTTFRIRLPKRWHSLATAAGD